MWRVVGLPWSSSRLSPFKIDHKLLKTKKILVAVNNKSQFKEKDKEKDKEKEKDYDKELGLDFPSSRFT